jgi:hypothetical protein
MKQVIFIFGLLSSLILPTSTQAIEDLRAAPDSDAWVMSIEVCRDMPPEVQDAIDRGIVFQPWLMMSPSCKWFGVGTQSLISNNELAIWSTYQDCVDAPISIPEGYTLRKKHCQVINQLNMP